MQLLRIDVSKQAGKKGRWCCKIRQIAHLCRRGGLHLHQQLPTAPHPMYAVIPFKQASQLTGPTVVDGASPTRSTNTLAVCRARCVSTLGSAGSMDIYWDLVSLRYQLGQPLSSIFTPEAQAHYSRLSKLLWRLRRAERSLNDAWRTLKVRRDRTMTAVSYICWLQFGWGLLCL
jgi:hypothetical protein